MRLKMEPHGQARDTFLFCFAQMFSRLGFAGIIRLILFVRLPVLGGIRRSTQYAFIHGQARGLLRRRIKNIRSFTLIEVLLVSTLFSLAGVMIYYSFSNGLKLWQRAQVIQKEESIQMFLDKMGEDLRHTIYFSKIKFEGQENLITFPCFVTTLADPESSRADEGLIDQIGAVAYEFIPLEKKIIRKQGNYAQANKRELPVTHVDLKDIDTLTFNFIFNGPEGYGPQPTAHELIPSLVEVDIGYRDAYKSRKSIHRLFPIPVGI